MPLMANDTASGQKGTVYSRIEWDKPESVKTFITQAVHSKESWRYSHEKQWFLNISYLLGYQNLIWSDHRRGLVAPQPMPHKARMVVNKVLGMVNTKKGKITSKSPVWSVRPATSDDHDIQVARLGERVLQYYWQYANMHQRYEQFIDWLFATGNAFWMVRWNPDKGAEMEVAPEDFESRFSEDETEKDEISQDAKKKYYEANDKSYDRMTLHTGDLEFEALGPFSVLWDERVAFDETEWCIVSRVRDLSYAHNKWPEHKDSIGPDADYQSLSNVWEKRVNELGASNSSAGQMDIVESVMVHEIFVKPCKRHARGRYAVVCGNVVTELGDNPYRMIPLVYAGELLVAGRNLATSTVEQCIPMQVDYNKTMSQLIENRNLTANPITLIPEDSGIPSTAWVSAPGKAWKYTTNEKGEKPSWMEPPSMPGYVTNHLGTLDKAFEDITGIHEVSNARSPSSGASGYLVDLLIEQDDSRVGPVIRRIENAIGMLGMKTLQILHMYVAEPRLLSIVGQDHEYDADAWFSGEDLLGRNAGQPNINYFDVRADISSALGESRAGKKEAIMALVNKAFFNPQDQNDKSYVLTALGVLGADNVMIDEMEFDRSKARDENVRMAAGEEIPVMPFENHLIEYQVHNRYRKTKEFKMLDPMVQAAFHQHADTHRAYMEGAIPPGQNVVPPMPGQAQAGVPQGQDMGMMAGGMGMPMPPEGGMPPGGQPMPMPM